MCYSHRPEFSNTQVYSIRRKFHDGNYVRIMDRTASAGAYIRTCTGTASSSNDGAVAVLVECDSRPAVGPTKTIRGVYMTQLNRLQRLAALSALREWSFYV